MRSLTAHLLAACGALTLVAAGCTDGGGTGVVSQPGEQESLFDDFFGASTARESADDGTNTAGGADNPQVPCEGADCPPDSPTPTVDVSDAFTCDAPHATPSGAAGACNAFCTKVATCAGAPEAAGACATDCGSTLGGIELAAASAIFDCYVQASCDEIAAYRGGTSTTNTDTPRDDSPGEPTPTDPSSGASPAPDPGGDGGGATPPSDGGGDDEGAPEPPGGDGPGPVVVDSNPIGSCVDGLFETWSTTPLPASKAAFCASAANVGDCDGGSTVSTPSEVPAGSGGSGGSSGSSDSGADNSAGAAPRERPEPPGDSGDPAPPFEDDEVEDDDDDDGACNAVAHLLTQSALDRIGACGAMSECDARNVCLDGELACLPFFASIGFGESSGSGSVTVEDTEPNSTEVPPSVPSETPAPQ